MAISIRISDRLHSVIERAAEKMHRSLRVLQIFGGNLRARERLMLKLGLAKQEGMYLFPVDLARQTKVRFPELKE